MRYTLITEGSSDRLLLSPIEWLLDLHCAIEFSGEWVDPGALENNSRELATRLQQAQQYYPCDLAFVHRDVDVFTYDVRRREIVGAVEDSRYAAPVVCTIPVRMTEAWFLFCEEAIRRAADRPSSRIDLRLPTPRELQRRADPKAILNAALVTASETSGRKAAEFRRDLSRRKALVASYIVDYSPLRRHESFVSFERDLRNILDECGWARPL